MMLLKSLLVLIVVLEPFDAQTTCNDVHFQACTVPLANMLQVDSVGFWNDPEALRNILQNRFTATTNGDRTNLTLISNSLMLFLQCLGPTNIGFCLGPIGFIRRGRSPEQAYAFDGILAQHQFMAGAGFFGVSDASLSCIQRIVLNFNSTLRTCLQTYMTNIVHDPDGGCTYASDLLNCYQAPFRQQCPAGQQQNQGGWWACETQRRYATQQYVTCTNLACSLTPSAETLDYIERHSKTENNMLKYKMPAKWTKVGSDWKYVEHDEWITN